MNSPARPGALRNSPMAARKIQTLFPRNTLPLRDENPVIAGGDIYVTGRDEIKRRDSCGASARTLTSGAGHDAAFVARIAPAAMIFVPSHDGKSHCPEEWTDPNALAIGADVLLNALCIRDQAEEPSTTPD